MLPDPRWKDALPAAQFFSQSCRCVELIARKDDDVEVITGELEADAVVQWLEGQVS